MRSWTSVICCNINQTTSARTFIHNKLAVVVVFLSLLGVSTASPVAYACGQMTTVTSGSELHAALECYRFQNPPGNHTITLAADITTESSETFSISAPIDENVELFINGADYALTGAGASDDPLAAPLFRITNYAKTTIENLKIQAAPGAAVKTVAPGSGVSDKDIILDNVTLFDSQYGLFMDGGGVVQFLNSQSRGHRKNGIFGEAGSRNPEVEIRNSEVSFNGSTGVEMGQFTGVIIENSTISNNGTDPASDSRHGVHTSRGLLKIVRSNIKNNPGEGIVSNSFNINITDSLVQDNGGIGIELGGTEYLGYATISNTGVYFNSTGIQLSSRENGIEDEEYIIDRSTIYGNTSTGISLSGTMPIKLIRSTVSTNGDQTEQFGDGIVASNAKLAIASSTIIKNVGDGVVGNPDTRALSSIIAGNNTSDQGYQDCADLGDGSTVQNLGANFDGDDTCGGFANMPLMIIEPIADNGCEFKLFDGSCVLTHNLAASNPAIGTGDCTGFDGSFPTIPALLDDQRNVPRDTVCDAGAIEIVSECNGKIVDVFIANGDLPTSGPDVILGTMGPDSITAMGGDDTICGLDGNDTISAGRGVDWVDAGFGDDTVDGGNDNDTIYGSAGVDILNGGPGDDMIYGEGEGDFIKGNSGNDTLEGGTGIDQILGGSGNDTISTGNGGNLNTGLQVNGGGGNDTITGGIDDDEIRGVSGNDTIFGGDGNDALFGGGGNDIIYGQDGDDMINGNGSKDKLYGGDGMDDINGGDAEDEIYGGNDDDFLFGSTGNDTIYGGPGNDSIEGQGGNDILFGNRGNDFLGGGGSNDTLNGGSDEDFCIGDSGVDSQTGCETTLDIP